MADPVRPNPDDLLASLQRTEARQTRGRLKIFFGMAPGVGKTYAMLEEAHRVLKTGRDVVLGIVETHGRDETQQLLQGLTILPRKLVEYRGSPLYELDLDALLLRKPDLVVVDELAHTNAPGVRHARRWQDVEELLAAGIDVFTTLNVQHIESRAGTVMQITGAPVHETVPDRLIETADEIELIDISPESLRTRLKEGKVYRGGRAAVAADNFFKEGNLVALRELALRLTAERVDKRLLEIKQERAPASIWRSRDRLMVAVGPSPFSTHLVRWTRRMAYALNASWIAVNIESGHLLEPEDRSRLDANLSLARELGAEVVITSGVDIAATLVRTALRHNVTQIVIGKPRGAHWLHFILGGSLADRLVRLSGDIDVYIVPAEERTGRRIWQEWQVRMMAPFKEYRNVLLTILAVTLFCYPLTSVIGYWSVSLIYLGTVVILGLNSGQGPILLAAGLSALFWNYLFIPPILTLSIGRLDDGIMLGMFFIIAFVTGRLTGKIRAQQRSEHDREQRAQALYQYTRAIGQARTAEQIVASAIGQMKRSLGADIVVFMADASGALTRHPQSTFDTDAKEQSVAGWVCQNRKIAGHFTDTLPSVTGYYVPVVDALRCHGVIGLRGPADSTLSFAQKEIITAFASHLASALEREYYHLASEAARLAESANQLHRALLDSVSHELKTPLAVIASAAEHLETMIREPQASALVGEIRMADARLQRLVNNLLDMTRIESGNLRPKLDWCDLHDVVNAALNATAEARGDRLIHRALPADLPLARVDFGLLEQALINLIHNACNHTPPGTPVTISAGVDEPSRRIWLAVTDEGPGIAGEIKPHLFEKFHRGHSGKPNGLGLGLSIVKGFVEALSGTVEATNLPDRGARFTIYLPWLETTQIPSE